MTDELQTGLGALVERFDHVSIAVRDVEAAAPLVALMGGSLKDGGDNAAAAFRWVQYDLPGDAKLEMIQPLPGAGHDHFLVRFLEEHGEGMHHVTLKVTDLDEAIRRAEALGFAVVGKDDSARNWREAFVHPKTAHGVLVQLAQWDDLPDPDDLTLQDIGAGIPDRYL